MNREQRIRSAVTRYNNRAAREAPLFAGVIETTLEEQEERYEQIDRAQADYVRGLEETESKLQTKGEALREQAKGLIAAEAFEVMEAKYNRTLAGLGGAYLCTFWRTEILKAGGEA